MRRSAGRKGLRVIGGALRGRRLEVPEGLAVRPTSDRAREALFDILGTRVRGATILDLFAGSGAVGIEALSRGAARAVFVESAPAAIKALEKNLDRHGLGPRARVIRAAWPSALVPALVLLEPPALEDSLPGTSIPLAGVHGVGGGAPAAGSIGVDVLTGAEPRSAGFTLVYADPPYQDAPYLRILETLSAPGLLTEDAVVVIEHEAGTAMPPEGGILGLQRVAVYGRAALAFYRLGTLDSSLAVTAP